MQELRMDLRAIRGIDPKDLPYIEWERVVNAGHGDEKLVREKVVLFDQKGSPFVWVDEGYISYNLKRGWKIVGYGNFDRVRRHDGTPHQALEDIRPLVEGRAYAYQEMAELRAENERLRAERAQLFSGRAAPAAPSTVGDLRTQEEKDAGSVSVVLDSPEASAPAEDVKAKNGKSK